jgi:phage tail protein X
MSGIRIEREGLMLDEAVAAAARSDSADRVEAVLAANPGLAARLARAGHELAVGEAVQFPETAPQPRRRATIQLWD